MQLTRIVTPFLVMCYLAASTFGKEIVDGIQNSDTFDEDSWIENDPKFWAIRGKRSTENIGNLQPDFLIKQTMKPNGLFGSFDTFPINKRKSWKPNSLFSTYKRLIQQTEGKQNMKRSSLQEKISRIEKIRIRLKNLFTSQRRAGLRQNKAYNKMMIKPVSILDNYKNNIKPNGLFGISKRNPTENERNEEDIKDDYHDKDFYEDETSFDTNEFLDKEANI